MLDIVNWVASIIVEAFFVVIFGTLMGLAALIFVRVLLPEDEFDNISMRDPRQTISITVLFGLHAIVKRYEQYILKMIYLLVAVIIVIICILLIASNYPQDTSGNLCRVYLDETHPNQVEYMANFQFAGGLLDYDIARVKFETFRHGFHRKFINELSGQVIKEDLNEKERYVRMGKIFEISEDLTPGLYFVRCLGSVRKSDIGQWGEFIHVFGFGDWVDKGLIGTHTWILSE